MSKKRFFKRQSRWALATLVAAAVWIASLASTLSSFTLQSATVGLRDARTSESPDDPAWRATTQLAETAVSLNPLNGEAWAYLARTHRTRLRQYSQPDSPLAVSRDVSDFYRDAIVRRPHFGELWTYYAMALDTEGVAFSPYVKAALRRASHLAPYRPFVILNDIELHLLNWTELAPEEHQRIQQKIDLMSVHEPRILAYSSVAVGAGEQLRSLTSDPLTLRYVEAAIAQRSKSAPE